MSKAKKRRYPRVYCPVTQPSMTKQSFGNECNINMIMAKFQKTGAISHYAKFAPTYGDATPVELHDALNIVADANSMFEELPSSLRKKFNNDPEQFLEFVQNPDNLEEMRKLGLANPAEPVSEEVKHSDTPTEPTGPAGKVDTTKAAPAATEA